MREGVKKKKIEWCCNDKKPDMEKSLRLCYQCYILINDIWLIKRTAEESYWCARSNSFLPYTSVNTVWTISFSDSRIIVAWKKRTYIIILGGDNSFGPNKCVRALLFMIICSIVASGLEMINDLRFSLVHFLTTRYRYYPLCVCMCVSVYVRVCFAFEITSEKNIAVAMKDWEKRKARKKKYDRFEHLVHFRLKCRRNLKRQIFASKV